METIMKMLKLIALLLLAGPVAYGMKENKNEKNSSKQADQKTPDPAIDTLTQYMITNYNELTRHITTNDKEKLIAVLSHKNFESEWARQEMLKRYLWIGAKNAKSNESLKTLIALGANVKKESKVLHNAIIHGNKKWVQALLEFGADVNFKNDFKWTPLRTAVENNKADMAELLLAHGADIGAYSDYYSTTPLVVAACKNFKDCIRLLVLNASPKLSHDYAKSFEYAKNAIDLATNDRKKLLALYGDQKSVGNVRTRTKRIIETLTDLLPKELLSLICDYDICIFTLETMIPSDQDLALIKNKWVEEVIECPICCDELNDENLIQLECHEAHKMCKTCFANDKLTKCPWCQGPIK